MIPFDPKAWEIIRSFEQEEGMAPLEHRFTTVESVRFALHLANALQSVEDEAVEKCTLLFDEYENGHKQEFFGGVNDSVSFTYRVMAIIRDNIRALKSKPGGENE